MKLINIKKLILLTSIVFINHNTLFSIEHGEFDDCIDIYNQKSKEKTHKREERIKEISNNNFLVFFYYGDQLASKHASKEVKSLEIKYDWTIQAISLDGALLDEFENNRINNGIYEEFKKHSPYSRMNGPVLFLFNKNNQNIIFLASGSSSFEGIENHIYSRFFPLD